MTVEDSVRFAHSGPSHNLLRPATAELVSCGPLPLPESGGGHASTITAILPPAGTKKATSSRLFCLLSGSKFLNFFVEAGGCKHILNVDVHAVSPVVVRVARVVDSFGSGITFAE